MAVDIDKLVETRTGEALEAELRKRLIFWKNKRNGVMPPKSLMIWFQSRMKNSCLCRVWKMFFWNIILYMEKQHTGWDILMVLWLEWSASCEISIADFP